MSHVSSAHRGTGAERRAQVAMFHLDNIRDKILFARKDTPHTNEKLIKLIEEIDGEADMGLETRISSRPSSTVRPELTYMECFLDRCITASQTRNPQKK